MNVQEQQVRVPSAVDRMDSRKLSTASCSFMRHAAPTCSLETDWKPLSWRRLAANHTLKERFDNFLFWIWFKSCFDHVLIMFKWFLNVVISQIILNVIENVLLKSIVLENITPDYFENNCKYMIKQWFE